jgi:Flp pilus assembly protein TadG
MAVFREHDEHGASTVELAFVAPSFLLIIFAVIQFALYEHAHDAALAAAREGVARLRTLPADGSLEANKAALEEAAELSARQLGAVQQPHADAEYPRGGRRVTVTVTGTAISLVPGWSFTVRSSAHGSIESFQPDLGNP